MMRWRPTTRPKARGASPRTHERFLEQEGLIAPTAQTTPQPISTQPTTMHDITSVPHQDQAHNPNKAFCYNFLESHSDISTADTITETITETITTSRRKNRDDAPKIRQLSLDAVKEITKHQTLLHSSDRDSNKVRDLLRRLRIVPTRFVQARTPKSSSSPPSYHEIEFDEDHITDPMPPVFGEGPNQSPYTSPFHFDHSAFAPHTSAVKNVEDVHSTMPTHDQLAQLHEPIKAKTKTNAVKMQELEDTLDITKGYPPLRFGRPSSAKGKDVEMLAKSENPDLPLHGEFLLHICTTGATARATSSLNDRFDTQLRDLNLPGVGATQVSESGTGTPCDKTFNGRINRRDPVRCLPPELIIDVFAILDPRSLVKAELVCKQWFRIARDNGLWNKVFDVQFGGTDSKNLNSGLHGRYPSGKAKASDWRSLVMTHLDLNKKWNGGVATAIYLEGHTDIVYCTQFDKEIIVTGSRDRTVRIWGTQTYRCLRVLGNPTNGSRELRPLPTNLFAQGQRPIARIFRPSTIVGNPEIPQIFHTGSILCLQYDPQILVTGSSDSSLIIWKWKPEFDCLPVQKLYGHDSGVLDLCFDSQNILSCSKDFTICHWSRSDGRLIQKLRGHRAPVNAVKMRGTLAVSASGDGTARLWDLAKGQCVRSFSSDRRGLACIDFSLDTKTIFAGGNNQVIYQFNSTTGDRLGELRGHRGLVRSVHLDSNNGRVISGGYDKRVKAFDIRTGETIVNFTNWMASWILCVKADYRRIVATSHDSRVVIMDFGYGIPAIDLLENLKYKGKAC